MSLLISAVAAFTFASSAAAQQQSVDGVLSVQESSSQGEYFVELDNGESYDVTAMPGCLPPEIKNGMAQINCSLSDGPVYYFDESTREIVQICSWLSDAENCPPRQWPIEAPGCDGRVSTDILGTWRLSSYAGPSGFSPVGGRGPSGAWPNDGGWSMTIAADSIAFDIYESAQIERPYAVVAQDDQRYVLELRDDFGETETIDIELAPCGLVVEAEAACTSFCQNMHNDVPFETVREIVLKLTAGRLDDDLVEEMLSRASDTTQRRSFFPVRSYFRQVILD
jgi:hypothetical protein